MSEKQKKQNNELTTPQVTYFIFSKYLFFKFLLQLIYNVVLVSGVRQSESVTHIHISTPFCF